jgi:hypothetical protein
MVSAGGGGLESGAGAEKGLRAEDSWQQLPRERAVVQRGASGFGGVYDDSWGCVSGTSLLVSRIACVSGNFFSPVMFSMSTVSRGRASALWEGRLE